VACTPALQEPRCAALTLGRSTRLYNVAMSYNGARGYNLDRDRDGIACENTRPAAFLS
jgi:Excalibur calcium-binding domain